MQISYAELLIVILLVEAAEKSSPSVADSHTNQLKEEALAENISKNATFPPDISNIRIPLEDMTTFIAEAKEHFFSDCVYIVHADTDTQDVSAYRLFSHFQQSLSSLSVHTAIVWFSTLLQNPKEMYCHNKMPLMITMFESEALKHYFQQLWKDQISAFNIWITFLHVEGWEEFLAAVNVPFFVQLLVAQPASEGSILLTEVYRMAPGFPLNISFHGEWERCGQNIWPTTEQYKRRTDLQGLTLISAAVNGSITVISEGTDGNMELISFSGSVWHEIKQMINVKITIKVPVDNGYGSVDSNGSWNGIISMLINNEADISATSLDMSPKRADAVDFLTPLLFSRYYIFIKKKSSYVPRWNSLLKPFDVCLWLIVLVAVVANATGLTIISKMGHRFYDEIYFSPSDSLLYVLAALAQQCGSFPRFTSARVVCICSHLMALVLLTSYSASLISFLTVQEEELPFHDLKSMVEVGTYRLILLHSTFEQELIAVNSTGVYRDVFIHVMGSSVNNSPTNYLDGLNRVCSSNNLGLMTNVISVGRFLSEAGCDFTSIPVDINHISSAFPIRKNSPYRGLLNICFQVIRERGIHQRLWRNYYRSLKMSEKDVEQRFIELTDILPLLAMFGFGCILALLLLALEVLSARMLKKHS